MVTVGQSYYPDVDGIGTVTVHANGTSKSYTVSDASDKTSKSLLAVWGVDLKKYWVMDTNGTIWERKDNKNRAVVLGMLKNDVVFKKAWVSPTGSVIAITDKGAWRLK